MNQKRLLMIDKLIIFNKDNNNNTDHHNIKDQSSNINDQYYKKYLEAYHYQSLKTFTSKSTSKLWPNDHQWSSLAMNGDDVSEEGSTTVTLKYPSTNDFIWCSSSMWLLAIIIVIYLTIFDCLIINTRVMASNPYVSGIKLPGNQIEDQTFYGEIKSLIGGRAELPCNLTLPSPDDAIQLIFWHRGNNTRVPIYTVDGRASQTLSNATHFLSDIFAPNRAIYDLTTKPSVLRIDPVLETDHSDYRCRVDFRWGRTINSFVSLHVIVPPKKITIRDQHGNYVHNSTIGPYDQNTDVILTCESNGGVPPPTLQWYKNGVMMDGSYVVGNDGLVSNELTVYKLSSNDLYDKYVCQAGNYNSSNSNPIEAFVVLDINLLPIDVRIVTNRTRLISGRKIEIKCETYGSKPAAIIKWFLNDKLLSHSTETYESNRTTSSITLIPSMMDNQALLKCRAYNPRMLPKGYFSSTSTTTKTELSPDKYLESVWKLEILYSPLVQLKIREVTNGGNTLNENGQSIETIPATKTTGMTMMMMTKPIMVINAKTSIIVECFVQANPSLVDLQIFHNSTIIQMHKQLDVQYQNVTKFLINSVDPSHGGRYQCVANNQQGITRSNIIQLDVLYAPFCKNYGQIKTLPESELSKIEKMDSSTSDPTKIPSNKYIQYALALNESVKLKCDVESNPKATRFYWTLNSDWLDENRIIAQSDHDNELIYTARSSDSYGTISCWASNNIGVQQEPCGFFIQKAGPPSPLHGCSVTNKTTTSLTVECFPGDNGGSKQMFHAHIFESTNSDDDEENDSLENVEHDEHHDLSQSILSNNKSKMPNKNNKKHKQKNDQNQHQKLETSLKSEINLTSATSPIFYLNNLTPGTSYKIELYAKNDRGNSDVVRLSVTTLFTKNTKLISSSLQEYEYDSWFSVLIGFLLTILLAVVAIYIVCRVRQRQISLKNRRKEEQIKQNFAFRPPNTNQSYLNVSDVDTDMIATAGGAAISSSSSATSATVPVNNDNEDKAIADDDDVVMVGGRDFLQSSPMVDLKSGSKTANSKNNSLKTPKTTMTTSNMNFGTKKSQQQQIHHQTPDIISFDSTTMDTTTNSNKLSLYVINEEDPSSTISLSNLLNKNNIQHHRQQLHHGSTYSNHNNLEPNPELQPIQLTTGSLLIGATAANVCDINVSNHHHVPAIFGSPFLATTNPNHLNNNRTGVTILTSNPHHHPHCLISSTSTPSGSSMTDTPPPSSSTQSLPSNQAVAPPSSLSQQQHHYFINASNPHETATTILYTSTIQPQTILSLNDKIDGIVLSTDHNDYYSQHDGQSLATSSSATPEATAILLHHPGHRITEQQQQQRFHQEISANDEEICDFNLQQTAV